MKILSLSGMVPECFCDIIRFDGYTGERNISHYCGYASDYISRVIQDDSIDGAIFPKSCDSTRILSSYLDNTGKFIYQIPVPSRSDEIGIRYYAFVLKDLEEKLCAYFSVDKCDLKERVTAINNRNKSIKEIYRNIEEKSFYSYLCYIHDMLKKPLLEQKISDSDIQPRRATDKRVYVIGSFLSNTGIVKMMEENGLTIVGDDLPEAGRLASMDEIDTKGDMYYNIAGAMIKMRKSPTRNQFEDISNVNMNEIKEKKVNGVIFVTQKYCEPYDYFYYKFKKQLDDMSIPSIQIALLDSQDDGKARLQIEAFADMI